MFNGPGARFLRANREIGNEAQKIIAGSNNAIEARLIKSDRFKIIGLLVNRLDCDLAFNLC